MPTRFYKKITLGDGVKAIVDYPYNGSKRSIGNSVTQKTKILVVEDEEAIRKGLVDVLVFHGYEVDTADQGDIGLQKALSGQHQLLLLDVMLPKLDGYTICNRVREQDPSLPIIMLTAKSSDSDIIEGLRLGADDYVAKPFSVAQLILRIQAVLRRSQQNNTNTQEITLSNGAYFNIDNLNGHFKGEPLIFTRKEIDLLSYLYHHHQRPVSRDELLNKVWGYDRQAEIETRTIDIHIAKLRRKLEHDHKNPEALITVRGAGYRLLIKEGDNKNNMNNGK